MTRQRRTTDHTGAFKSYHITPEEYELTEWTADRKLFDAGTSATFGRARQDVIKGAGPITVKARAAFFNSSSSGGSAVQRDSQ